MTKKKMFAGVLLVGLGLGGWRAAVWYLDREPPTVDLMVNRVWIERLPADPRDLVRELVVLKRSDQSVGIAARASRWHADVDAFLWAMEGDNRLAARFPQDNRRATFAVRAWRCAGQAPAPFELCLELGRGARKIQFYSRADWIVAADGTARGDNRVNWLAPTWDHLGLAPHDDSGAPPATEAAPDWTPFD
jgi:hypothetical protein